MRQICQSAICVAALAASTMSSHAALLTLASGESFGDTAYVSGTSSLSFSATSVATWNLLDASINSLVPVAQPTDMAVVRNADGSYQGIQFTSNANTATLNTVTHAIDKVSSTDGFLITGTVVSQVSNGGYLMLSNLNIDVANRIVYGDVQGGNGVGSFTQKALWQAGNVSTSVTKTGMDSGQDLIDYQITLSNLSYSSGTYNTVVGSLGAIGYGRMAIISTDGDFGTFVINTKLRTTSGYFATAVPESNRFALMGLGLLFLTVMARRKHQA